MPFTLIKVSGDVYYSSGFLFELPQVVLSNFLSIIIDTKHHGNWLRN